jgi:flagellar hook-associated protein 3 FlgL
MRVTNKMMTDNITVNLSRQIQQLYEKQKMISSGKKIHRPSDDPVAAGKVLDYRKTLAAIEQYGHNITLGKTRLELSETVLDETYELLNSAINMATDEASGHLDTRPTTLAGIATLRDQIVHLANSKLGDNYLYSGHQTDTVPFSHHIEINGAVPGDIEFGLATDATDALIEIRDATDTIVRTISLGDGITPGSAGTAGINTVAWNGLDNGGGALPDGVYSFSLTASNAGLQVVDYETYNGDNGDFRVIVGDNLDVSITANGSTIFTDIFYRLSQVQQGLQDPDPATGNALLSAALNPLESAHNQLKTVRAEGAVNYQYLETTESRYTKLTLNVEDMLSAAEDVDVTQAIVELQSMETAYETYLATIARIMQPSLVNFLS